MNYRRHHEGRASYFFTINLQDRSQGLLTQHIDLLKHALRHTKAKHPFHIDAMVVLPDHLHCIWTMPENDGDYSRRWGLIKGEFSKGLPLMETSSPSRLNKGERGIWQRRFWEHQIRDDRDYENHINYIHINPVKHGYANSVAEWPHSSFHKYVRDGVLPLNWGGGVDVEQMNYGEKYR